MSDERVEIIARALHARGEGGKITWAQELADAQPGTWGVTDYYREWAAELIAEVEASGYEVVKLEAMGWDSLEADGGVTFYTPSGDAIRGDQAPPLYRKLSP